MTEVKEVGKGIQPIDDLKNGRRYWELKEETEDKKAGDNSLSIEHKEEIKVIFISPLTC